VFGQVNPDIDSSQNIFVLWQFSMNIKNASQMFYQYALLNMYHLPFAEILFSIRCP